MAKNVIVSSTLVRQVVFSELVEVRRIEEHPDESARRRKSGRAARLSGGGDVPPLMLTEEQRAEVRSLKPSDSAAYERMVAEMTSSRVVEAITEPRSDTSSDVDRAFAADRGHHHGGDGCFYCARSVGAYEAQDDILNDYLDG